MVIGCTYNIPYEEPSRTAKTGMAKFFWSTFKLLLSLSFISSQCSASQSRQVWRITPTSEQELNIIKEIGNTFKVDFWISPAAVGRPIDFLVESRKSNEIAVAMRRAGLLKHDVYIQDVDSLINQQFQRTRAASTAFTVADFDYSIYHPADEIYAWIDMVAQEYDTFTTKRQIGVTYEGRPMYALEFHKPSSSGPKPKIFVDSLIHCREWITTASLIFVFKEMLQNPDYAHMLDEVDWYFVPMINVDGYVKTWRPETRLWRKTTRPTASSKCDGVDGNRNWDNYWSMPGASPYPCDLDYHGPTAASESEVRNLADYVLGFGYGNISSYITVHSYTQLILYPYGYAPVITPDNDYLDSTGKAMSDAIKAVHGKEYYYGLSATGIYVTSGATDDWVYDKAGATLTYTFELRDTGEYGFLLPDDQIIPQGEELLAGFEALKNIVAQNN